MGFGEINTFLPRNPQVAGPSDGLKSNPWTVMSGQSPQNIGGAMDNEASSRNTEVGLIMQYLIRQFADKRHERIITGDIVFALRSKSQQTGPVTVLSIGELNNVLRIGFHQNLARFKSMKQMNDDYKDVVYLPESDLFGTRWYDEWKESFSQSKLVTEDSTVGGEGNDSDNDDDDDDDGVSRRNEKRRVTIVAEQTNGYIEDLKEVLSKKNSSYRATAGGNEFERLVNANLERELAAAIAKQRIYVKSRRFWMEKKDLMTEGLRFLYAGSIMDHWNMLGVVRSSTNDTGIANNLMNNAGGKGTAVAVTVSKKTFTCTNYFGSALEPWDKLWLILKRVKDGPFQYYPWSNGQERPEYQDLVYVDMSGNLALGQVIYVGRLSESLNGVLRSQEVRAGACGLIPNRNGQEIYNDVVNLDKLTMYVGVK